MKSTGNADTGGRRLKPYFGLLTRLVQRARLAAALPHVPAGARLLDLGCGLTDLPARFASYVGCDRNPVVLSEMRRRHPGAAFAAWDLDADEPPPEVLAGVPYDAILMLALLEHLPSPARALGRAAALLAPGGRLVATTPHPLGRMPLEAGARLGLLSRHADEEHETLLDRAALEGAAASAGLELTDYSRFLAGLNQLAVLTRR
jgi:SAM-dependent methyltransferase